MERLVLVGVDRPVHILGQAAAASGHDLVLAAGLKLEQHVFARERRAAEVVQHALQIVRMLAERARAVLLDERRRDQGLEMRAQLLVEALLVNLVPVVMDRRLSCSCVASCSRSRWGLAASIARAYPCDHQEPFVLTCRAPIGRKGGRDAA